MATKEMIIKLMVDPESNRLIFAEASKDFVDFLIFLLSLPIATAIKLLTNESMLVGSIGNIHTSVANLEENFLRPNVNKNSILNPVFFSSVTNINPLSVSQSSIISSGKLYNCGDPKCKKGVTNICNGAYCPGCSRKMNHEIKFIAGSDDLINNVNPRNNDKVSEEGYVQEIVSYIISDDLSVTPISAMAMLSMMNKFNVSKFEEKKVKIGTEEALELLKTSFHSTTVISDVFLKSKKRKQPGSSVQEKMQIFVRGPSGKTMVLEVEFSDTIKNVKAKIQEKEGFPAEIQRLRFSRWILENNQTLAYYNVQKHCTLHLWLHQGKVPAVCNRQEKILIFIKNLVGRTITLEVEQSDTIAKIKSEYEAIEGTPPHRQRLLFAGRQLKDGQTIADYDIPNESTIHLIKRLK